MDAVGLQFAAAHVWDRSRRCRKLTAERAKEMSCMPVSIFQYPILMLEAISRGLI